jgi:hypothetical protein
MPEYFGVYFFLSAEQTGTGSAQNVAHTLGKLPERVLPFLTGGPASYSQPTITLGTHTADNLVATVTTGWKYRLMAVA